MARASTAGAPFAALLTLLMGSHALAAVPSCEAHAIHGHKALLAGALANWEPVDNEAVLVWAKRTTRAYLIKLSRPLVGVMSAEIITLIDGDGDQAISACGHDAITLGESGDGSAVGIVSIELLSEERTAELDHAAQIPPVVAMSRT